MAQNGTLAAERLLLYADSILRHGIIPPTSLTSRRSNSELVLSLRNLLSATLTEETSFDFDPSTLTVRIPHPDSISPTPSISSEPRAGLDVTVKFFYLSASGEAAESRYNPEWTAEALNELKRTTGLETVDTFIASFPHFVFDDSNDDGCLEDAKVRDVVKQSQNEDLLDMAAVDHVWAHLSGMSQIRSLGLSEFSLTRLQSFLASLPQSSRRPIVNQINLRDCCSIPPALATFAKQEHIKLFTHVDCSDLLPHETFLNLFDRYDKAGHLPSPLAGGALRQFEAKWVLKYTVVVKNRNVVADKGYIVAAGR